MGIEDPRTYSSSLKLAPQMLTWSSSFFSSIPVAPPLVLQQKSSSSGA